MPPRPPPPFRVTATSWRRRSLAGAGAAALCLLGLAGQLFLSIVHRQRWTGEFVTGSDHANPLESKVLQTASLPATSINGRSPLETSLPDSVVRQAPANSHPKSNRSSLVIHIGPPKVGSTYIQCSLCGAEPTTVGNQVNKEDDRSLAQFLAMDSYVFLGTCPWRVCGLEQEPDWDEVLQHRVEAFMTRNLGLSHLVGPSVWTNPVPAGDVRNRTTTIQPEVLRRLDHLQERGLNGLLVYEGLSVFDPLWIAQLSAYLRSYNWKVTIVVAYRPLFAWLPSKYNSVTKVGKNPAVRFWPDDPICRTLKSGCHGIEPFSLHVSPVGSGRITDKFASYVAHLEATGIHPAHASSLNYRAHFDDVRILPLHRLSASAMAGRGDPMLEYLFCELIDGAPIACRAVRGLAHAETASRNPSDNSQDYDRLALRAHDLGWLRNGSRTNNNTASRSDVRAWAESFHHLHLLDAPLPRACLGASELDRLEQLSWQMEWRLFQNATDGRGENDKPGAEWANEARHHEEFQRAVQKGQAYCWVDADRTFREEPRWRPFFESPFDPTSQVR